MLVVTVEGLLLLWVIYGIVTAWENIRAKWQWFRSLFKKKEA